MKPNSHYNMSKQIKYMLSTYTDKVVRNIFKRAMISASWIMKLIKKNLPAKKIVTPVNKLRNI